MNNALYGLLAVLVVMNAFWSTGSRHHHVALAALGLTTALVGGVAISLGANWLAFAWMLSGAAIMLWALTFTASGQLPMRRQGWLRRLGVIAVALLVGLGLAALLAWGHLPAASFGGTGSGALRTEALLQQAPSLMAIALALISSLLYTSHRRRD